MRATPSMPSGASPTTSMPASSSTPRRALRMAAASSTSRTRGADSVSGRGCSIWLSCGWVIGAWYPDERALMPCVRAYPDRDLGRWTARCARRRCAVAAGCGSSRSGRVPGPRSGTLPSASEPRASGLSPMLANLCGPDTVCPNRPIKPGQELRRPGAGSGAGWPHAPTWRSCSPTTTCWTRSSRRSTAGRIRVGDRWLTTSPPATTSASTWTAR